jgi:peptide deformylase
VDYLKVVFGQQCAHGADFSQRSRAAGMLVAELIQHDIDHTESPIFTYAT